MTPAVRNTVFASLAFVAVVVGMFVYSVTRPPLLDRDALQREGIVTLPTPRPLEPFSLTDHRGEPFGPRDLDGRWSFLFFGFTSCPDVCPLALAALAQVEDRLDGGADRELADAFNVVLVSVDPERDDEATLARYVGAFSDRFTGVRGSREAVAALAQQVNVAFMKVPTGDGGYSVDHTGNIVIVNPRGEYYGFIKMPHDADKILTAYRSIAAAF